MSEGADRAAAAALRRAGAADAGAIAALHAESWRRHYRGAYSDAFLDGDVLEDRLVVWRERLAAEEDARVTIIAEAGAPVGFVNAYLAADPRSGTLVENLHVARDVQRGGLGRRLMAAVAEVCCSRARGEGMYLWVLEQNAPAQAFYEAIGGRPGESARVEPPGGVPGRLYGSPRKLRYVWPAPLTLRRE